MATIKDIAKAASCSISTVSYALNDDTRISESTAKRIKKLAKEMNYMPSAAARNLKKKNTNTILVAISDFGGPVYHALLDGIHHELANNNYTMIVSTGASTDNLLKQRTADGAIISDINIPNKFLEKISLNFKPIIVLDRDLDSENIYNLTINNRKAMYHLTKDVISKGYKKIGFVHGVNNTYDNQSRFMGFKDALQEGNLEVYREYYGNFTKDSGEVIGKQIIDSNDNPDMLICSNDEMALGVMEVLLENNIEIPDQIGISGFDDITLSRYINPKLTSIKIDHFEWGKRIARTLIKLLKDEKISVLKEEGKLVKRESY